MLAKDTSKLKSDGMLVDSRWTWLMSFFDDKSGIIVLGE